jgi:hypothetical protein
MAVAPAAMSCTSWQCAASLQPVLSRAVCVSALTASGIGRSSHGAVPMYMSNSCCLVHTATAVISVLIAHNSAAQRHS